MLRFDFVSRSPGSRRAWEIAVTDLVAELRRERASRERTYPQRVAKGSMTEEQASDEKAILADILADFEAVAAFEALWQAQLKAPQGEAYRATFPLPRREAAFGWEPKLHCLRREIALRRRFYPEWIAKGRLSQGAARQQLERLEAVQARYWLDWWGHGPRSEIQRDRAPYRAHLARIEAAIGLPHDTGDPAFRRSDAPKQIAQPEQQKEMAL